MGHRRRIRLSWQAQRQAARIAPESWRCDHVRDDGSGPDPRKATPRGLRTRGMCIAYLHIDAIRVKTWELW